MGKKFSIIAVSITLLLFLYNELIYAYSTEVHEKITKEVINQNTIKYNNYLKNIGLTNGVDELLDKKKLREWIEKGSIKEDYNWTLLNNPLFSHFYNPLINKSGVGDIWFSAYEWADASVNPWSWRKARDNFYKGFTLTSKAEREKALADAFRAVGHVSHLVQDVGTPAHVRGDLHISEPYEKYTNKNIGSLSYTSIPFQYWNLSISPYAPKQFWDLESYSGSIPYGSGYIGLAEYTNANFASSDTIFSETLLSLDPLYFPFPRKSSSILYEETNPQGKKTKYFKIIKESENIDHFAVAGRFYDIFDGWPNLQRSFISLDDKCHKDYVQKLIPRAVGYSAGLLNYFFRGEIDMIPDDARGSGYVIENKTDEDMNGTFELWYDNKSGERAKVLGANWTLNIPKNDKSTNIGFTSPSDAKERNKYILVFRGKMGQEQDAVVGKAVELKSEFIFLVNSDSLSQGYLKYTIFALKYFIKDGIYHIKTAGSGKIFEVDKNIFSKKDATFYGGDPYTQYGNVNPLIQSRPDKGEHVIIVPDKYSPWINGFGVGRVKYGGWQGWRWVDYYYLMGTRFGYRPKNFTENAEYIFSTFDNGNKGSTSDGKNLAAIGRRNFTLNSNKNILASFDNFIYGDIIKNTNVTEPNGNNGSSTYTELIKSYKISNRSTSDLEFAKDDTKSTTINTWFYTPFRQEGIYSYFSKVIRMNGTKAEGVSNSIIATLDENNAMYLKTEYINQRDYGTSWRGPNEYGIRSGITDNITQGSYPIGEVFQGTEGRGDTNTWQESSKKTLNKAQHQFIIGSTVIESLESKKELSENVYVPFGNLGFYSDYLFNEKANSLAIMDYDNQYGAENIILFYNIDTIDSSDNVVAAWQSSNDKNSPLSSATWTRTHSIRITNAFYLYYKIGGKTEKIQLEALKTDSNWALNSTGLLFSTFCYPLSSGGLETDNCINADYILALNFPLYNPSNPPKTVTGNRITGVSSQINDNNMVYTYIVEEYKNNKYVFVKRVIGIINKSDPRLPIGHRQEFEITDANAGNIFGEQYKDQNGNIVYSYKGIAAIGEHAD